MEEQSIGKRLSILMQALDCKAAEFARQLGIRPSNVSHIVNGRSDPSCRLLQSIFTQFPNVNPDWLILGQGSMFRQQGEGRREVSLPFDSLFVAPPTPAKPSVSAPSTSVPPSDSHTQPPPSPTPDDEAKEPQQVTTLEPPDSSGDEFGDILVLRRNGTYIRYREGRE